MEQGRLRERIVEVLCEEWEKTRAGTLRSETIYERLVGEGEEIPDEAINRTLSRLKAGNQIRATRLQNREAILKHGNWTITAVRTDKLC